MGLIGMILAAVLVAVLLAIVIVKYLPLKLRWVASIILLVLSGFLVYKIYYGIMQPIIFNKQKVTKYAKVIKQLKIIRNAEIKHLEVVGTYTKDKAALISFIDTAKVALTETKTIVEKEDRGGGVIIDVEVRKTDTIGYESVAKSFKGINYKDMFKVPGEKGKEFEIEVGTVEKVQGLVVPTFLVKTEKVGILKGMDASLIKQELEAVATDQIKGEYVSVGSLNDVSTGGNWPPFYDKKAGDDEKK
jgi:hypothetical protein